MQLPSRTLVVGALMLWSASAPHAQTAIDPTGHWEGSIEVQGTELPIQVDLSKNSDGQLEGTLGLPSQHLKGLRLLKVAVEGNTIRFHARRDQPFGGSVSANGQSISGDYSIEGFSAPFILTRTGDARVEPPVKSLPIARELEGTWNATLPADGGMRIVLTMLNHSDGTATGRVVNLDEGGLEIPVAIIQKDSSVTLDAGPTLGGFSGALNAGATELVGEWTQGTASVPVTFRHAAGQ